MQMAGPRGFGDQGRREFFFRDSGSTGYYFRGTAEQAHNFGDLGCPAQKLKIDLKNHTLKKKPPFRLI